MKELIVDSYFKEISHERMEIQDDSYLGGIFFKYWREWNMFIGSRETSHRKILNVNKKAGMREGAIC